MKVVNPSPYVEYQEGGINYRLRFIREDRGGRVGYRLEWRNDKEQQQDIDFSWLSVTDLKALLLLAEEITK